jgi:hypothetical protein
MLGHYDAGKGTASPPIGSIVGDDAEDGYANGSPMETTKTVSTGLWKSRKEREIPTFAQPRLVWGKREEQKARGQRLDQQLKVSVAVS